MLSSIAAIAAHNHSAVACVVGCHGDSGALAMYRPATEDRGLKQDEEAPCLQMQGKLVGLPGVPTAVAWSDSTLACGTCEGTVELFRADAASRGGPIQSLAATHSLQPQKAAAASARLRPAGTGYVAVGAADSRNSNRICAIVNGVPCLWDGDGHPLNLGAGWSDVRCGVASGLDLDWDKGLVFLGASHVCGNDVYALDPRASDAPSQRHPELAASPSPVRTASVALHLRGAHMAAVSSVRCSPLQSHWVASAGCDGLVKVWDVRRADSCVFRLAWHLSAVTDVSWSWAHSEVLVSGGRDGSQRFWHLGLAPHPQLAAADGGWEQQELVGCCMVSWHGHPLDTIAASVTGSLQAARMSPRKLWQPLVRRVVQRLCAGVAHAREAGGNDSGPASSEQRAMEKSAQQVAMAAALRRQDDGARALVALLPVLSWPGDLAGLDAGERFSCMMLSAEDLRDLNKRASELQDTLLHAGAEAPSARGGAAVARVLCWHEAGAVLSATPVAHEVDAPCVCVSALYVCACVCVFARARACVRACEHVP